jgi:hypothetical protein
MLAGHCGVLRRLVAAVGCDEGSWWMMMAGDGKNVLWLMMMLMI